MSTTGCCRGLSAKDCLARPYGCFDGPQPKPAPKPKAHLMREEDDPSADLAPHYKTEGIDVYACAYSTLIGFRNELTEQNIKFICDQISRKAALAPHDKIADSSGPNPGAIGASKEAGALTDIATVAPASTVSHDKTEG